MKLFPLSALLFSSALLGACASQPPAQVVLKGNNFYGESGMSSQMRVASVSVPKVTSGSVKAIPAAKPAALQMAAAAAPQESHSFTPSESTTSLRERVELAQVSVKELEPLSVAKASPSEPQPQLATIDQQDVLPEPQARVVAESNIPTASTSTATVSKNGFIWPVRGKVISGFGPKAGGEYNDGINIAAQQGEPIVAAAAGEVVYSGDELRGYGNMVILRHDNGLMTAYAHADRVLVSKGERVQQGVTIATVGKSGGVDQAQVHFGVRKDKEPVDPMGFLGSNNFASR
jgi:murein DD-endopeptidase MepM/ murein hydrolase activator NlpD